MAKIVTFLGRPGRPDSNLILDGMNPWIPGEGRLFDDEYAQRYGFNSGDDFAEFFIAVYNGGQKTALFTMGDAPETKPGTDSNTGTNTGTNTGEKPAQEK